MTPPVAATTRADRLVDLLEERDLDCLLVTNLVNVRYLTGFTGSNGACIVSRDERVFLTDFRYVEQASAPRSEEHTSELQSRQYLVCRLLLEKKKKGQ